MERSLVRTLSGRLRSPWRLLLATVFFVILSLAGSLAFFAFEALVFDFGTAVSIVGVGTASGLATALGVVVAARSLDRRSLADLGLSGDAEWWRDLGVGLTLGSGLVVALYLAALALGVYRPRFAPAAPDGLSVLVGVALVTAFMCVVGLYEELVFRGYVLTNVAEGLSALLDARVAVFGAVALSSLAFAAVHGANPNMNALGVGTIVVAGVALALGYVLTGRLALPIGFHVTWNLAHVVLGLPVSGLDLGIRLLETDRAGPAVVHGGAVGPEGGLLGFAAALAGCLAIVVYARAVGGGVETAAAIADPPAGRTGE